jgi:YVTN family beta-propeller protein
MQHKSQEEAMRALQRLVVLAACLVGATSGLAQPVSGTGNGMVFTANEGGRSISVIDARSGSVETTQLSIVPHNVQSSVDGRLIFAVGSPVMAGGAMAMENRGRLLVLDAMAVSKGPTSEIEVGRQPAHVIVDAGAARAFVTNAADNALSVVDLARRQVVRTIAVGGSPHGLRMSPDRRSIYVANTGDGTVSVVDVETLAETFRIPVGRGPVQVAFTPDGKQLYVTLRDENGTAVVDTATRQVIARIAVGSGPIQVFAAPNGQEMYVANQGTEAAPGTTVSVISTVSRTVVAEIITAPGAHGVVVSPHGDRVFVANSFADTISVIDTATRQVIRSIAVGAGPGGITTPSN